MAETLRELVVSLSLDSNNFTRNLRTINQQIKEAESTFRLAGAGVENFEKTVGGTQAKLSMLGSKLGNQNRSVEQYSRALNAANQKLSASYASQQKLTQSLSGARQKMDQAKAAVRSAAAEYKRLSSTLGENDSATIMAKENLERCKQEYKAARGEVKQLEGQLKSNSKTLQNNADAISKAQTNLNNAQAAVRATQAEIQRLTQELYRMQSRWTQAGDALVNFSRRCAPISKSLTTTGKGLMKFVSAPIVALGASAIKSGIDFESSFTSVRKTVDASEEEFARLAQASKRMSSQVAASTSEINEVMANGGQLGIATDNLEGFTKVMIDLGNSCEDLNADEAATALAKFANVMGTDQTKFENVGSVLVDLGNNYATTEAAIMEMSKRLAGAGRQVGLTESQIMGFAAALSSVGIEAQMGGSAFSKALIKMEVAAALGGQALEDFARVSGMTAEEFKAVWESDPAAAFQAFIVGLASMDDAGMSAISTLNEIGISEIRLRDTLLRATNATELFKNTQITANKAWEENTALSVEANKRYATTESKLKNLKNEAILFAQQIGDDLNPSIQSLIQQGHELLASFLALDEGQRMTIIRFAGIAAAAGPVALVMGKTVGAIGKVSEKLGEEMQAIGKFSAKVQTAGGGFGGLLKVVGSSKLAIAALSAALVYGAYKFLDYASGAKATREALEGMCETAEAWKNTAAETFYGNSGGLSAFGMSKEDFAEPAMGGQEWVDGLIKVWSDGQKEADEIVDQWTGSFKKLTEGTRTELKQLQQNASEGGYTSLSEQLAQDIETLDSMDAEIEQLLKRKQNGLLSDKDKLRLQELIDTREDLIIKYKLEPDEASGFDALRNKIQAAQARAQARGEEVDTSVYKDAIVAAAEGMTAMNQAIDEQYDKEYTVIQLIEDEAERSKALEALNDKYNADRLAAAQEYAETLQGIVTPVWNTPEIQEADKGIDTLTQKLREYSIASQNNDTEGMTKALQDMNELTAGMDEGALTEYVGLLTQIQSLMDSGMSEEQVQSMFPEIDVSGQLAQLSQLAAFVAQHKDSLEGLSGIFGEALPEEVLKITTDLDMTGAQQRWSEFAANPGAITTKAVIESYNDTVAAKAIQPKVDALISSYTEVAEGASTASLTPKGLIAYVEAYAEATTGADVSGLTPEGVTAMVSAYQELAESADVTQLKPDEITAYISKYLEEAGVDTTGLKPEAVTAFVLAYEEVTGGASTTALKPTDISAIVTNYLQGEGVDISKLTQPQIEALVTSFAEATGCDKSALKAEVQAKITAYVDAEGVTKPTFIQSTIAVTGLDLASYNAFVRNNPIELKGTVRLGEVYDTPSDVLNEPNVKVYENGREIPVNLVPANKIDANTLLAYDTDGTMHVLITPELGSTEAVDSVNAQADKGPLDDTIFAWADTSTSESVAAIQSMIGYIDTLKQKITEANKEGLLPDLTTTDALYNAEQAFGGITDQLTNLTEADLTTIGGQIAALTAALSDPDLEPGKAEEYKAQLQGLLDLVGAADQYLGTGNNVSAGIAQGMTDYGWNGDAGTLATNITDAVNSALGIASPAASMTPTGDFIAQGIGQGMTTHDFSVDAAAVTANLVAAFTAAAASGSFAPIGAAIMQAISASISSGVSGTGGESGAGGGISSAASGGITGVIAGIAANLQATAARYLNDTTLYSVGASVMSGLTAGLMAGGAGGGGVAGGVGGSAGVGGEGAGSTGGVAGIIAGIATSLQAMATLYLNGATLYTAGYDAMNGLASGLTAGGASVTSALTGAFSGLDGAAVAQGLGTAMANVDMTTPVSQIADKVRAAGATYFTSTTLRSAGVNVMRGLAAGINSGRSSVVSAMRNATRAAVSAAKSALKISSPSKVFKEEVGAMAMRGFSEGIQLESKAQARTIRNAMRYLTDEARENAVAYSHNDNRRTYNQQSSVSLTGNTFYIRDERDVRSLAIEISTLTRQQQHGRGLGMA